MNRRYVVKLPWGCFAESHKDAADQFIDALNLWGANWHLEITNTETDEKFIYEVEAEKKHPLGQDYTYKGL